jgi:molybdopterin-guanine dinucleotide biosynthesis protein A
MGRDKALLPFHGATLAATVSREVARAAGSATLVGNPELGGIPDLYPGEGPLGGILTALRHTVAPWNLVVACDMPALHAHFLQRLLEEAWARGADVLLPCCPGGLPEPLCAVYHKRALPAIDQRFAAGVRKVTRALDGLVVARLEVEEVACFQNVNTPEDWAVHAAE